MADTAYDQARQWLADQLHDSQCNPTHPAACDLGAIVHAHHGGDAEDILDGCEVREEWGVRYNGADTTWCPDEEVARGWVRADQRGIAHLVHRYVITTPATEE